MEQNEGLAGTLRSPLEAEKGSKATEQQFDIGSMLFFEESRRIYVLFGDRQGTFRVFEKKDLEKLPAPSSPPDSCSVPMQGGFALIWANNQDVREQLGCPLSPEPNLFPGAYQLFEGGTLLWSQRGLGRGQTIYAALKDGTYTRYRDPNQ